MMSLFVIVCVEFLISYPLLLWVSPEEKVAASAAAAAAAAAVFVAFVVIFVVAFVVHT